jgi:hypothetical protein
MIQGYGPIDKEEKEVDVFNRQGFYLYRTKLPRNTYVIKNGYLYAHDLNEEEGLESVKKYEITNWKQLNNNTLAPGIPIEAARDQAFLSLPFSMSSMPW